MRDQLTGAIQQRRIVTFTYRGHPRRVQPAAYGIGNRKGKETLHAYQVDGGSERGGLPHWRNFHVDQIESLSVLDEVFGPNPPGFRPNPFPQTQVALAASPSQPATEQQQPWGGTGGSEGSGGSGAKADQVIPGVPISAEQAAKAADAAAEAASKAFGALGKWLRKR
ncbi:MAG TPA: WYL domain-containing protein [Frankiaceae bacterium]|nr:WYL domain-containing protein [Frankiaceae bacterium]